MDLTDPRIPNELRSFLAHIYTVQGKSVKTTQEYFYDLRTFFRYLKRRRTEMNIELDEVDISDIDLAFISSVTLNDAQDFMMYIANKCKNGAAARARKVCSLRAFYKYLTKSAGKLKTNPLEDLQGPRQKKTLPKYLELNESLKLLQTIDSTHPQRDYCIITLFLNCGMRISELVGINLSDISYESRTLRLLGKGNKERIISLNDACIEAIQAYLKVRPVDGVKDKNALFISKRMQRLSAKTIQWVLPRFFEKAGLGGRGLSAHKLRHTAATLMYQHGSVDIRALKEILGHQNLNTTEIYTHISNKEIEAAINANPLAHVSPPVKGGKIKKEE